MISQRRKAMLYKRIVLDDGEEINNVYPCEEAEPMKGFICVWQGEDLQYINENYIARIEASDSRLMKVKDEPDLSTFVNEERW